MKSKFGEFFENLHGNNFVWLVLSKPEYRSSRGIYMISYRHVLKILVMSENRQYLSFS